MFWAIASSIFIIYLYRKLNAEGARAHAGAADQTVESELDELSASIASLESKIEKFSRGVVKP